MLVLLFFFLSSHSCLLILVTLAMECYFMYGWNFFMYEMMDGTCLCMKWWMDLVYVWNDVWTCLCDECLWNISICHIYFLCKLWDLTKNRKNRQYAGSLPSATDGKELFAVCRGRQRSHVAANCASWELTHLVSLPTVADGKDFAVRGRRQRTCTLPSVADGKEPAI